MRQSGRQAFLNIAIFGVLPLLISNRAISQNTFPATGNVGVGTTNPSGALEVRTNGSGSAFLVTNLSAQGLRVGPWQYSNDINIDPIVSNGNIHFGRDNATKYWTFESGYVGVGTTNPATTLSVSSSQGSDNSTVAVSVTNTLQGNGWGPGISNITNTTNTSSSAAVGMYTSGAANSGVYNTSYIGFVNAGGNGSTSNFGTLGLTGKDFILNWTGNGNVGIRTTNPQYPLSVNGTIQAKEVLVNTGWADYVFKPGYRVRPLSEVAMFIKANHHLPDIPSETEVKDKGVSLGEMQTKLLAKIEELTLQMIQLDEKNRALAKKLAQLEAR